MINNFFQIFSSRLGLKITLLFIALATMPLFALGGTALSLLNLSHSRDVSALELQLIGQRSKEIEKFFADALGILELKVGFEEKLEINITDQKFLLEGLLAENSAFTEVGFANLNGLETTRRSRRNPQDTSLQDISHLENFKVASEGASYIGSVQHTLNGPQVLLASPVRNKNGIIIQVLTAEVSLAGLVDSIDKAALGSSGYLALLDGSGTFVMSGRDGAEIAFAPPGAGADFSSWSRVGKILAGSILDGLAAEDRYISPISGKPVIGAGKKVEPIGWVLLAEWPIADADAVLLAIRRQIIVFTFFSILIVLALAPVFASRLVRPIGALKRGAASVEKGEFETTVTIKTKDELEELGNAFNQMTKGLKRLQELRDEFVFIAAHELRAPVTAIRGYVSMILDGTAGAVSEKAQHYLSSVDKAAGGLAQLVNDLLEIARSEAGRIEAELRPVELQSAVEEALITIRPLSQEKNIEVLYESPKQPAVNFQIMADADWLKEVLINLAGNAIKYNHPSGWVRIYHETLRDESGIVTHVADNGLGIPKEAQAHVFEKFFRVKNETTYGIVGTGLGLFIVKDLVEKMGGEIWFESEEGKGTIFSFKLPIVENKI